MGIQYKTDAIGFLDSVSVEDAEDLLGWIQKNPNCLVDFSRCTHLHAANLQVLMATRIAVAQWPQDQDLKNWLVAALKF